MIDSTNIRIIADNIRHLFKKVNSIEPGTLVEGNPSGSGFNTLLTKIKIGSSKYKLPKDVTANPEGEATDTLSKLQIGSDIFGMSDGVTANPEGAATESLSKLGIGSDIFSVFSGFAITSDEVKTGFKYTTKDIYVKLFTPSTNADVYNDNWQDSKVAMANTGIDSVLLAFGYHSAKNMWLPLVIKKNTSGNDNFDVSSVINTMGSTKNYTISNYIFFYTKS